MNIRVGMGYDVHKLVPGRALWLGGIKIDHTLGLLGHSDADVLIHAICDALLGAANMRDIGYHFPDTSADTLDMDSKIILRQTIDLLATKGYRLGNIDATICAERPKINPHVEAMKACLAEVIGCDTDQISIKATTTERLGFTGREEGISAYAVCLIEKLPDALCHLLVIRNVRIGIVAAPLKLNVLDQSARQSHNKDEHTLSYKSIHIYLCLW